MPPNINMNERLLLSIPASTTVITEQPVPTQTLIHNQTIFAEDVASVNNTGTQITFSREQKEALTCLVLSEIAVAIYCLLA